MTTAKSFDRIVTGRATSDGAGVKLTRLLGSPELQMLDPFLMLDAFRSDRADDYIAGFPPHPHRGFETVTYMLAGRMRHRDNKGNEGVIGPGGVQWMTAGRGIVHSEMPEQEEGLMWGFQLWVNLPKALKMATPAYRDIEDADIPRDRRAGSVAKVIAGTTSAGVSGAVTDSPAAPLYLDVHVEPGGVFEEAVDPDWQGFVAPYEGQLTGPTTAAGDAAPNQSVGVLGAGETVRLSAGQSGAKALVILGAPLSEPVAWHGPFVMTTRDELVQAVEDYQAGRF